MRTLEDAFEIIGFFSLALLFLVVLPVEAVFDLGWVTWKDLLAPFGFLSVGFLIGYMIGRCGE